jgi:two-component system, chemotaxis family, protein-glutamate methylesterase/glutaminase
VVVHHLDPRHRSLMAEILSRRTKLAVQEAREGDHLRPRTAFVAPPDYHLLVNQDGTLSLSHSEVLRVVDRAYAQALAWNVAAENLWGLRSINARRRSVSGSRASLAA